MNIVRYNKKKNREIFMCWILVSLALTVAYGTELIIGNRTVEYYIQFMMFTWIPLFICYGLSLIIGTDNLNIKYGIVIGYLIFYMFTLFTSNICSIWVVIIPIVASLIMYNDTNLIWGTSIVVIAMNMIKIFIDMSKHIEYTWTVTDYEVQIGSLALAGFFLIRASNILDYGNTKLIQLNEEITKDELTNCYNRYFLTSFIEDKFKFDDKSVLCNNISLSVIDIDNFKYINDTYGHRFGDLVLKKIASIIIKSIGDTNDTHVIRIGGDEFIIISSLLTKDEMYDLAVECNKQIDESAIMYGDTSVNFHVSIGIANSEDDKASNYNDLYIAADTYLHKAKSGGKNNIIKD